MKFPDAHLTFLEKYKEAGLLFFRVGVGIDFLLLHGWNKLAGGPERWARLGTAMPGFDMEGIYLFWGLMAALTETLGAVLFAFGLLYRPVSALLGITMIVAVIAHVSEGDPWGASSHALKMAVVFFGLMMAGPGKYSLDHKLWKH
ncbi:MAG: DoxX family protein [Gracilimonas sp.]|uniref:DoxX family protein n=1 Tax=Gracilimonas sp. TaxID=1974203 RepID=UPI00198782BC|nr:DoxX family protein [Gracilimonas sp.]MBD3617372.1 DoxX family protein [Gracilimonas sp.]